MDRFTDSPQIVDWHRIAEDKPKKDRSSYIGWIVLGLFLLGSMMKP